MIAVWHPFGSGTGRRMFQVTSCADDTHLTIGFPTTTMGKNAGGFGIELRGGQPRTLADLGMVREVTSPANYYDNVAAYYALYYRSGIDDYLTAARTLADRFWESPRIDQGVHPNFYGYGGRSVSALGLVLRALDGRPDMWSAPAGAAYGGLHTIWNDFMYFLNVDDPAWGPGLWDTRECAYHLAMVSYCALSDSSPSYQSTCKAAIVKSFSTVWTPFEFPDGSWPQLYSSIASWTTTPPTSVTLTKGSATVTGVGTNWSSSAFPAGTLIWFTNSPSPAPPNNAAGDPVTYTVTSVNSATQLTLSSPYQGTTGSHGWEISPTNALGWTSQPFMIGILSGAFDLAAKAIMAVDAGNPSPADQNAINLAHSYNVAAANWIKDYGYWPASKGLYYYVNGIGCQPPISDSNILCTGGNSPGQARTLSAEAMRGLSAAYAYTQDPSLLAFADTMYNAMWARPTTCRAGSTTCVPDGNYIDPMDDGQYMIAVPPLSSLGTATPWKWLGMFFGYSAESSWPGYRVGGVQPRVPEPLYIGANLPGVPGAAAIRVLITDPSGVTYTTNCSALPCAVTVDHRQGDHLMSIQYLSASGVVLASSRIPLIGGQ